MENKENKIHTTKDLGCAAYLKAKRFNLHSAQKDDRLVKFTFVDTDPISINKEMDNYYKGGEVSAIDFWLAQKHLKTIIHERRTV
jgi:hypothetical protein